MWTQFWDMHSGGSLKEKWAKIYIEAPEKEAMIIFYNRFGHNPYRISCTCCGEDYSISEEEDLAQITGYHRGCAYENKSGYLERASQKRSWASYITLEDYIKSDDVLVIFKEDIKDSERIGEVPREEYVWV